MVKNVFVGLVFVWLMILTAVVYNNAKINTKGFQNITISNTEWQSVIEKNTNNLKTVVDIVLNHANHRKGHHGHETHKHQEELTEEERQDTAGS